MWNQILQCTRQNNLRLIELVIYSRLKPGLWMILKKHSTYYKEEKKGEYFEGTKK